MTPPEDLSGLELSRLFFAEVVAPIVARVAPALRYTAGRFGGRSDALGFDDQVSRDHGWAPGCTLLLDPAVRALPPRIGSLDQLLAVRDLEEGLRQWRAMFRGLVAGSSPASPGSAR